MGDKKKALAWIFEIDWKDEKESKGNLRGKFVNRGVEQRGRRSQSEPPLLAPTCPLWTMRIPYLLLINHYGHFLAEMRFSHSLDIIRLQKIFTWVQSYLQDEAIHRIAH